MADGHVGGGGDDGKDGNGKGEGDAGESAAGLREGQFLLGLPTFRETENGRFRCVETGHELSSRDMIESYGRGKGCRVGLIDAALTQHKPPLNMFKPDPLSKSKIICKLTGDTINKSEEHIWKHINGKRFQKKLDQKEAEMKANVLTSNGVTKNNSKKEKKKAGKAAANGDVERNPKKSDGLSSTGQKMIKKKQRQDTTGTHSLANDEIAENSGSEEPDFWVPPVGSRWDFDDGKDRWEVSASETDDISLDEADPEDETIAVDLSARTKRMSVAVGPSSFATRKKKNKTKD